MRGREINIHQWSEERKKGRRKRRNKSYFNRRMTADRENIKTWMD